MRVRVKTYHLSARGRHRLFVATDTHYEACRSGEMEEIIVEAKKAEPDSILLAGDTINYLEDIRTKASRAYLGGILKQLAEISPVYVGIGNHDQTRHERLRSLARAEELQGEYIDFIESIPEVTLLHNKRVKLADGINLVGITLPLSCYQAGNAEATHEDIAKLREVLAEHDKILARQSKAETNILVIHSPRRLTPEIIEGLSGVDYVVCGHMHQGCVPLGLDEVIPGTRGIIAPGYAPFPVRARHTYPRYSKKLLVLPAYKTFSEYRRFLNVIFPRSLTILDLDKNR